MSYKKALLIFMGAFLSMRLLLIALPFDAYVGGLSTPFLIVAAFTPYILATVVFVRTNQKTFVRKEVWIMAVFSATLTLMYRTVEMAYSGEFEAIQQKIMLEVGQDAFAQLDSAIFIFMGFIMFVSFILVDAFTYHFAGKIAKRFLVKNPETA